MNDWIGTKSDFLTKKSFITDITRKGSYPIFSMGLYINFQITFVHKWHLTNFTRERLFLACVEQLNFSQKIPYYIFHMSKAFHQCVLAYVEELFFCQKMPYHIFRKEMTFPYLQSGSFVSISVTFSCIRLIA